MQKLLFTLFISLFGINQSFAQSNFIDGGIVQLNGDTLLGQIDYQEWALNPEKIDFTKSKTAKINVFEAKDIAGFFLKDKNEFYQSAIVDLNIEKSSANLLPIYESKRDAFSKYQPLHDTVFLLVIERGEINFYEYVDKNRAHYLVNKGNEPIKELVFRKFVIDNEVEKSKDITFSYDYRTQFRLLFSTCPSLNIDFERLPFIKSRFIKLIRKYNECSNNVVYTQNKEKKERSASFLAGVTLPLFAVDVSFPQTKFKNNAGSVAPVFGLEMAINSRRMRGRQGGGLGFRASSFSFSDTEGTEVTYYGKMTYLKMYAFIKQDLRDKKVKSFVKFGAGAAKFINTDFTVTKKYLYVPGSYILKKQLLKHNFTRLGGFGLSKGPFSLELQYELNTNLAYFNRSELIKANQVSLLAGYKFFRKTK
jgi:hypothetical protein